MPSCTSGSTTSSTDGLIQPKGTWAKPRRTTGARKPAAAQATCGTSPACITICSWPSAKRRNLRNSSLPKKKKPRQYSLVRFLFDNLPTEYHSQYPFTRDGVYVYFGEIPNMPGHCV